MGSLQSTGSDGMLGRPQPAALQAMTLNWYMAPSSRPVTSQLLPSGSALIGSRVTRVQRLAVVSFLSMKYPVMEDPPSYLGSSQLTVMDSRQTSVTVGFSH